MTQNRSSSSIGPKDIERILAVLEQTSAHTRSVLMQEIICATFSSSKQASAQKLHASAQSFKVLIKASFFMTS
ncbi:hypothetical protein [Cyclobacterium marinum]|uniref:hypothetical protein n=1 Tax=Cyclobacterium marinum TaxID=104 RepID=UPI0012F9E2A7|nr:hypothetical protein [Cyclobacterium marinum]